MDEDHLVVECKKGLDMNTDPSPLIDGGIKQRIRTVKAFMMGAGVSKDKLNDPLSVGVIVLGVADLWNLKSGEVKFSPVFYTLLNQLVIRSGVSSDEA